MYMSFAYFAISNGYETVENFEEAVSNSLKVIECSQKTDNKFYLISAYGSLARQYPRIGDLEKANYYLDKLCKMGSDIGLGPWFDFYFAASKGAIESAKENWEESNKHFKRALELVKGIGNSAVWDKRIRRHYIWSLKRQGKTAEAEIQVGIVNDRFELIAKQFSAPSVKANLMGKRTVDIGKELEIRLDLVNVSRNPALAVAIKDLHLNELRATALPATCSVENGVLRVTNGDIGPFEINTTKIKLKAFKVGVFCLNPQGTFLNEAGEVNTFEIEPITITVTPKKEQEKLIDNPRVAFGYTEIDNLLLGGIPEKYAVVLTAAASNQEELLKEKFLEKGLEEAEITLYLTSNVETAKRLADRFTDNLLCIVCNPQTDTLVSNGSKIIKLKGVENLTEIDIATIKALRTIIERENLQKRACIDILSDVLLQHHALNTRKWLSGMLLTLKSKGFTTLAIINPLMHPAEEIQATLSLFDGEIELIDRGLEKVLMIRRLHGQTLKGQIVVIK
jgi:tetratricopeptide (TPR) repeat protein